MIDTLKTLETNPEIFLCSAPPAYSSNWEISDSTFHNGVIPIVNRIAVNYIGLYDNDVAKLWSDFITHDHSDGLNEWKLTEWGSPLIKYRREASQRLKRVNGKLYLVIQNGDEYGTKDFVESVLPRTCNFHFSNINTNEIFDSFPNKIAVHEHNDIWALLPSMYRTKTRKWMNICVSKSIEKQSFEIRKGLNWEEKWYDSCTKNWRKNWTLDGKKATITHSEKGMDFKAGPNRREDASHAVLWTKQSFNGDIKIEYEYTKMDDVIEALNIRYIQATGSGAQDYDIDISQWANKRKIPSMREYFNRMNTLHISWR